MRGCRWSQTPVKTNTKWTSPSKTHHEIDILMQLLQKSIGFTIENQHPLLKSPAWTLWTPCHQIHPFWSGRSRMVFGHNLQHMALSGTLTAGFCMLFRYATLILSTLGPKNMAPRPEISKLLLEKPCRTRMVNIPNGAICCKLWPQTILGPQP